MAQHRHDERLVIARGAYASRVEAMSTKMPSSSSFMFIDILFIRRLTHVMILYEILHQNSGYDETRSASHKRGASNHQLHLSLTTAPMSDSMSDNAHPPGWEMATSMIHLLLVATTTCWDHGLAMTRHDGTSGVTSLSTSLVTRLVRRVSDLYSCCNMQIECDESRPRGGRPSNCELCICRGAGAGPDS